MMLADQKHLFSLDSNVHYLNNAYMAPMLKEVEEIGIKEIQRRRNPFNYTLSDFFEPAHQLKSLFAQLINESEADRVAIIPSVSYGLSNAAMNVAPKTNGNVVLLEGQFPSNFYIWQRLCEDCNMTIRTVKKPGNEMSWSEAVLESIDKNTAAVSIAHVHWADGSLFDLAAISQRCREVNAFFIIDGTQSVGALPFNNALIQADAVICAGYKWLLGAYGLGLAYYGPKYDDGIPIEENWLTRLRSDEFSQLVDYEPNHRPMAWKYNVGESSNFIYVQMLIACLKQILKWNPASIQGYCKTISEPTLEQLKSLGCEIAPSHDRASHLFGIVPQEGLEMKNLMNRLMESKIFVSQRGKYVRVSPHLYSDVNDFETMKSCFI